jgi:transcription elongation factor GreA
MEEPSLSDAASKFAASLSPAARTVAMGDVNRFVRWFGPERPPAQIRGHDVELYAEALGPAVPETSKKADQVRAFLSYMKKEGIVASSLAPHLRLRKSMKRSGAATVKRDPDTVELTADGIAALNSERDSLIAQRPAIREEIRRAMLDKDFRENAPLDAAKDKQGHVEARIREIEAMLRRAVEVDSSGASDRVRVGVVVSVTNLKDGSSRQFSIVGPTEANAADGKISSVSPVGKALLDHKAGDEVEVSVPSGVQRFRIEEVSA